MAKVTTLNTFLSFVIVLMFNTCDVANAKTIHVGGKNPIKKIGATSAEHALGLSLILGCKPIFIQGVDIPTKYYHGKQIGKKYYGYESIYADNFEDKTMRFLKKINILKGFQIY
jgi:hypothetical protein